MDALKCIMTRRSCKKFKPDMPDDTDILTVTDAARLAPSGFNKQSWHFTVVSNKDWLDKINERARSLVTQSSLASNMERNGKKGYSCNYHSPVLILVSNNPSHVTAESDTACALQNMFLAAHALGLGTCWINQLGKSNAQNFKDLFDEAGVPSGDLVYACCALGYPEDGLKSASPRAENSVIYFK